MLGILLRVVAAGVIAVGLVVGSTVVRVWQVARIDDRRPADTLLVMGSAQYDGRPSAVLEARLQHALTLWKAGVAPVVVTVGGRREGDRYSEAGAGRVWLLGHGVPAERIVAVERGITTRTSLQEAALVYRERGWASAVVVTDPWHELRSEEIARDYGIDAVPSPARSGPSVRTRGTQLRYILRETGAVLCYRIGRTCANDRPGVI